MGDENACAGVIEELDMWYPTSKPLHPYVRIRRVKERTDTLCRNIAELLDIFEEERLFYTTIEGLSGYKHDMIEERIRRIFSSLDDYIHERGGHEAFLDRLGKSETIRGRK